MLQAAAARALREALSDDQALLFRLQLHVA
jgi:hypothetical protein